MSWNQNPPGGQPGGYGGQPGFGGQGGPGFPGQPGGGNPGYPGQPGGGNPGYPGQPGGPQQGYPGQPGGQGFGGGPQQGGPGAPQGFMGQPGYGGVPPTGQPPKKKSNAMLFGILGAALAVLILGGVLFMVLSGGDDPVPQPQPPTPSPTISSPGPTVSPTPSPGPTQTTPGGGSIQLPGGMSFDPAAGWTIEKQEGSSVLLKAPGGQLMAVSVGRSTDPEADVASILDSFTQSGSDVSTGELRRHDVNPGLNVVQQSAQMTLASGGASGRVGVSTIVSARKSDQVAFSVTLIAPVNSFSDEAFTDQADGMINQLLRSQVAGG